MGTLNKLPGQDLASILHLKGQEVVKAQKNWKTKIKTATTVSEEWD